MYRKLYAVLMSLFLTITVLPQSIYAEEETEETTEEITETEEISEEEEAAPEEITEEEETSEIIPEETEEPEEEPVPDVTEEPEEEAVPEVTEEPEEETAPEEIVVEEEPSDIIPEATEVPEEDVVSEVIEDQEEESVPEEEPVIEETPEPEEKEVTEEVTTEPVKEEIKEEVPEEESVPEITEEEEPEEGSEPVPKETAEPETEEEAVEETVEETAGTEAADDVFEGFEYTSNGSEITITRYIGSDTEVVIPSEIDGLPVTCIGNYAFEVEYDFDDGHCINPITSIVIPSSVIRIEDDAFYLCDTLLHILIPDSVTSIGEETFSGCSSLKTAGPVGSGSDYEFGWPTSIPENAFSGCSSLTSVTIPDSVTSIGSSAFYGCSSLTSVTIPDSVTSIGDSAFSGCSGLTSITIPNSVISIGDHAFSCCRNLTSIMIPENITSIENHTYYGCSSLTSITIPESVTSIGANAFEDCSSLTSIMIPDSVISISGYAFSGCMDLTSIIIPNSITELGYRVFGDCRSLTSITIPESVTTIGIEAFEGCSSLPHISIPDSVTSIGKKAFFSCDYLKDITIPQATANIGEYAFGYLPEYDEYGHETPIAVVSFIVYGCAGSKAEEYASENGLVFKNIGGFEFVNNDAKLTITNYTGEDLELIIPSEINGFPVAGIDSYAFYNCSSLLKITIPNTVTSIGEKAVGYYDSDGPCKKEGFTIYGYSDTRAQEYAFENEFLFIELGDYEYTKSNSAVTIDKYTGTNTEIIIPAKIDGLPVTGIGDYAFLNCSNITSIVVPSSLKRIGSCAFAGCSSLKSIAIPDGITSIGTRAFTGCTSLKTAGPIGSGANFEANYGTISRIYKEGGEFSNCGLSTIESLEVVIPDGITEIDYEFWYWRNLTSLTIPDSVTHIADNAFEGCENLTKINIPAGVTEFDHDNYYTSGVFNGCSSLKTAGPVGSGANIEYGWTSKIPDYAFYGSSITSIIIPDTVTSIGESAFQYSDSLKSITIPDSVAKIGRNAFEGCKTLKSVVIPDSITEISDNLFSGCSSLKSVKIPKSVKSIGENAFYKCSSLSSVTIPSSVTTIGEGAFFDCSDLAHVTIPGSVTDLGSSPFGGYSSLKTAGPIGSGTNIEYGWRKKIPDNAFDYCRCLTDVKFPDSLTTIGYEAFSGTGLIHLTIPESVTSIEWRAFYNCENLISIQILGKNVDVWSSAFGACDKVVSFIANCSMDSGLSDWTDRWTDINTIKCRNLFSLKENQFENNNCLKEIGFISTDLINSYAFFNCSNLKTVHIRNTVKTIDLGAFRNCPDDMTIHFYGTEEEWNAINVKKYNDSLKSATVVYHIPVTSIKFNQSEVTLNIGTSKTVKPVITPANAANKNVKWQSGNDYVATVDKNGKVKALHIGSTWIEAVTEDGDYSDMYYVNVKQPINGSDISAIAAQTYTGKTITPAVTVAINGKNLRRNKDYTVSYKNNTSVGTATAVITGIGNYSGKKTVDFKILPEATASVKAENLATGIKVTWERVTGATGYYVYRGTKQISKISKGSTVTYTDKEANTNGTKYTYKIVAYAAVGKSKKSKSVTTYKLKKPAISSLKNSAEGKIKVKWGKNDKATGYQIQYSKSSSFPSKATKTLNITSKTTVSKVIGSLAKGVKYYVRIRAYKTVSSKKYYSAWCAVKSKVTSGWKKVSGKWYYYKANGAKAVGWQKISKKWYYFLSNGAMVTGWKKLSGKWYYFLKDGSMVTGTRKIGSKTYKFNKKGVCLNP